MQRPGREGERCGCTCRCGNRWGEDKKRGCSRICNPLKCLAELTGLEPAASGVTGRRYNQLNYSSALVTWWAEQGSNL